MIIVEMPDTHANLGGREMLSPEQVAEYLGIGRTKVYELLNTSLKSYKIGKRRVISKSHLDDWLAEQLYDPTDEYTW